MILIEQIRDKLNMMIISTNKVIMIIKSYVCEFTPKFDNHRNQYNSLSQSYQVLLQIKNKVFSVFSSIIIKKKIDPIRVIQTWNRELDQ